MYVVTPCGYPDLIKTFKSKDEALKYIRYQPDLPDKYRDDNRGKWCVMTLLEFSEWVENWIPGFGEKNQYPRRSTVKRKVGIKKVVSKKSR
jgi:hypothetical protein